MDFDCWLAGRLPGRACPLLAALEEGRDVVLDVPAVKRLSDFDCGPVALASFLGFWDYKLPKLDALGIPSPIDGTDPRIIEPILRRLGLRVRSGESDLDEVAFHLGKGRPSLALIQQEGVGHWVVVHGRTGRRYKRVHLMDPSHGKVTWSDAQFEAGWIEVCRDGALFHNWSITAWPG